MLKLRYPLELESVMLECFESLKDDYEVELEVEGTITEVCHESYDGFIPFTNGGYQLTIPSTLYDIYGRGHTFMDDDIAKQLDKDCQYSLNCALESFCDQHADELKKHYTTEQIEKYDADAINYHDLYDKNESGLAETLSEYEYEYMTEGSTFFVEFRVQYYLADNHRNESGVDEICFMSGVNLDYDYGRDKGLEVAYEETVPVKGLTEDIIKHHIKAMSNEI